MSKPPRFERRESKTCHLFVATVLACILPLTANTALAAELDIELSRSSHPEGYRRVFVPVDSPEEWPIGKEHYLPILKSKFEQLAQQQSKPLVDSGSTAWLTGGSYYGELVEDQLLVGRAELEIQTSSQQSRLLPLAPINLSITSATWKKNSDNRVEMGLWRQADLRQNRAVLVAQSDVLQLNWQLRARDTSSSSTDFRLELPVVAPQSLTLVLPENHSAVLSSGELLRTENLPSGKSRWWFQLGPADSHSLKILRQSKASSKKTLPLASRSTFYHLEPEGLTFLTTLHLGADESSSRDLVFAISGGAKVLSVTEDQQEVIWRIDESLEGTQLIVERGASHLPRSLEIRCIAQMQFDQTWQLPLLRPQEVSWSESSTRLRVSRGLELRQLVPRQALLQQIEGIADKRPEEEVYHLQEWSEDSSVEVVVGRARSQLQIRAATTIDVDPTDSEVQNSRSNESTAQMIVDLSCKGRPVYQLEAEVSPNWSIESVKTVPASALGEWHLIEDSDRRMMRIQLNEPVLFDKQLRLEIDSRFVNEGSLLPTRVNLISPLKFLMGRQTRNLLLLRSRQQGQMELLHGLDQSQLTAAAIDARDATLLPELSDGVLLDLTHLDENALIELQTGRDRYDAKVRVDVRVLPDSFVQHYRIDCTPISGVVSEVVVQFDQALPSRAQWKLVGHQGNVVAKRLHMTETKNPSEIQSPTYRLQFPAIGNGPFRLEVRYSEPARESQACNLLSLPDTSDWHAQVAEASSWRGQVVVRGPLAGLQIDDQGWTPIALPEAEAIAEPSLPVLGCYRLNAEGHAGSDPLVVNKRVDKSPDPSLFAWISDIQSLYAANGDAIYVATYHLENTGSAGADIRLPEGAELQEAWVDQQHLEPRKILVNDRNCRFHFNSSRRYPTLSVQYLVRDVALQHSMILEPLLPECSFPIGVGRWTLWTPEQFTVGNSEGESGLRLSWDKRLFGPLSRSTGQSVFDPFRIGSWNAIWSTPLHNLRNSRRASRFAKSLKSQFKEDVQQSWGELINSVSIATATNHLFLIDRVALRQQGIEADALVGLAATLGESSQDPSVGGGDFNPLRSKGLALIASKDSLLLTTDLRVSQWRDLLVQTDTPTVFSVVSSQLASQMQGPANRNVSPLEDAVVGNVDFVVADFVGIETWLATPRYADPPWNTNSSTLLAGVGRRAVTFDFIGTPPKVVVSRHRVQRAQWHVAWLLTLTLGVWLMPRFTNRLVLSLVISATACLVVPAAWLVWVQAIFLGLLSAFILTLLFSKLSWRTLDRPRPQTATRSAVVVSFLLAIFLCSQAYADSPSDAADQKVDGQSAHLHQVLFPIDSDGNPRGDDVYVPESLLEQLVSGPKNLTHDGAQNLLVSALYRGTLPVDPENISSAEATWSIVLEAKSFVANSELELPFRRDEAEWLEDVHRLDGLPIKLSWNSDSNGCRLNLGPAGPHRLELKIKPRFDFNSSQVSLSLQVPRLLRAGIDISVPSDLSELNIPSAGQIQVDKATGRWQAPLAASGRLEMSWTPARIRHESDSIGEVEQMAWLHVNPSDVKLDVQILVKTPSKVPGQLVLAISERLELLPLGENSPIKAIDSTSEKPGVLILKLKENLESPLKLPLQFRLERETPLGHIFYPRIRLQHAASVRSLFAVSVAQGFFYEESSTEELHSLEVEQFAARWGAAENFPLFAYSQTDDSPPGSLQVWPDRETFSAQQSMRVHCDIKHAHIDFEAEINKTTGNWLMHRIWAPERFLVEDISVKRRSNGETVPVRWSRVNRSQIALFSGQPLKGPHTLAVQGIVEASEEGVLALPAISLVGSDRKELHVDLTREADVLIRSENRPLGTQEAFLETRRRTDAKIPTGKWTWRLAGSHETETLLLEKNHLQYTADTLTTISQGASGWKATLHAAVHVQKGVLSQITLSVPNGFGQPELIQPEGLSKNGEVRETASGRQITFLLLEPVEARKTFTLEIAGDLDLPANQQLEVPHLQLTGSTHSKRYLLLPTRIEDRSVAWKWGDLQPKTLPKNLRQLVESQENTRAFLVESNQFFARERSYQGPLRNANFRYAVITGTLDQEGLLSATAELVVQPGRATHCTLRLPAGAVLEQLVTGDRRVRRERVDNRSWRVPLGPPFLPRKIKVVYQMKTEWTSRSVQLIPPEILIGDRSLPIPQTFWKIHPAEGLQFGKALVGRSLSSEFFARSSHQLPLEALEASRLLAFELPLEEGRAWFQPWQRDTLRAWNEWRAHEPSASAILEDQTPILLGDEVQSKEKVDFWSVLTDKLGDAPLASGASLSLRASYPPALPVRSISLRSDTEYYFASDQQGQLILAIQPTAKSSLWMWFLAVVTGISGFAFVVRLQSIPNWQANLNDQASLLTIAIGIFWWIFLAPSVVGLLLVVLVLASKATCFGRKILERWRKSRAQL